ncbi:hypothetical protein SAPIO_CDS7096 [Scedosporium apiospermum]|uniref:Uncharacterized protein n=1 Tax=Pseudallescheria apiosperma TaxID=563466 RepID=A0A084G139_PSEDA|nr:uncharacterized protein SAPIO_CDS7096 [Scedosporium apiospermum]KEZ41051.1 hypothetical protein SAPIO_CDS7096 [Scedosporium apiospermum]
MAGKDKAFERVEAAIAHTRADIAALTRYFDQCEVLAELYSRPVYLAKSRRGQQRAHFAIFIPHAAYSGLDPNDRSKPCIGTVIQVVGAPMLGYAHEFKRNYDREDADGVETFVHLGSVGPDHIVEPQTTAMSRDTVATGLLERIALQVPAPGVNENFMAPVNDTTNRRCQEWTMEYLRRLVSQGHIEESAVTIAQGERDPPEYGIGLRRVGS